MDELEEMIAFWDDFADDYDSIQEESATTLLDDLNTFVKKQPLFPVSSFLDLAGGTGKYIEVFLPLVERYTLVDFSPRMLNIARKKAKHSNVTFIEQTQASFLAQTRDCSFDVVFSAMNPALDTPKQLQELLRIAKKAVYLLRLVADEDVLFSPLEEKPFNLMHQYKKWLHCMPFQVVEFVYLLEETIEKSFFYEYFSEEIPYATLEKIAATYFKTDSTFLNPRQVIFELLIIPVSQEEVAR